MPDTLNIRDMVRELIATPSMSSTLPEYDLSNHDVVNMIANWLNDLGLSVAVNPVPGRPNKANLIATLGKGDNGLVLSGHTDTVPLDEDLWDSDPFTIKEVSNRWYGLGTSDMKSFFALIIEAVKPYIGKQLKHPIVIVGTADEESSMSGIRALEAADIRQARYALIGEPTSLKPINKHKGIMMLRADISGRSGHSSDPERGASALDASVGVLEELMAFREHLKTTYQDPLFDVYYPTLNLGCIHGGKNPNRICDQVSISLDIRTLPGMRNEDVFRELAERINNLQHDPGLSCSVDLLHDAIPPFANDREELLGTLEALTDNTPCAVAFATEAPFLSDLGVETIVLGPGSIDQAHQPNEYIELNQLDPTVAIIRALIEKYCL
jgi:acetylornithine deacetylase